MRAYLILRHSVLYKKPTILVMAETDLAELDATLAALADPGNIDKSK